MKRFLKKNIKISILCFVSLAIVISYAITYNIPDYFNIEGWYSLFNNISISYIAAFIFYVFQVYIPECNKSKRAQKNLRPLFLDLIKFIEITISCWREYVNLDKDGRLLIDWWDNKLKVLYYVVITEGEESHQSALKLTAAEFKNLDSTFKSKIKEIKERVNITECDSDVLDTFSDLELKATRFFRDINTAVLLERTFMVFSPLRLSGVNDFEKKKDDLKQYFGIKCKYGIRKANKKEIELYESIYNDFVNIT